jgi:hypothetical protein
MAVESGVFKRVVEGHHLSVLPPPELPSNPQASTIRNI